MKPVLSPTAENPEWRIRGMESRDQARVFEIERGCFPSAWTHMVLAQVIATPHMRTFVVEEGEIVQGFVIVGTKAGVVQIWNLAVSEDARRRGLGTALLSRVLHLARLERFKTVVLSVREGNLGAQLAYRRAGFRAINIRHLGYGDEDAYEMRLDLDPGGASAPASSLDSRTSARRHERDDSRSDGRQRRSE